MCALIRLNKNIINSILHVSMYSMWITNELIATTYTDLGIDLVGALTLPWLDEVLYDLPEWAFLVGPNLLLQVLLVDNREVRFLRPPFNVRVVHEGAHRTLGVVNGLGHGSGGRRHRDFTGTGEASEWGDMAGVEFIDLHAWPMCTCLRQRPSRPLLNIACIPGATSTLQGSAKLPVLHSIWFADVLVLNTRDARVGVLNQCVRLSKPSRELTLEMRFRNFLTCEQHRFVKEKHVTEMQPDLNSPKLIENILQSSKSTNLGRSGYSGYGTTKNNYEGNV